MSRRSTFPAPPSPGLATSRGIATPRFTVLSRRQLLACGGVLGAYVAHGALSAGLSGCASNPGQQRRVTLESWLQTDSLPEFENAQGYEVTLNSAELGIDHLYFVTGDPVGGALSRFSWVSVAHAHPGHYAAGSTLGEMNEAASLDLLGESRRLNRSEGVTGEARSCVLRFGHLDDGDAAVCVRGVAVKGEQRIRFEAQARLEELLNSASDLPEVPGVPLDDGVIESDGRMTFSASPDVWLDQVDFSQLASTDDDALRQFKAETQPQNAFVRGVLKAAAYRVAYEGLT